MPKKPLKCCNSFIISLVILITAFTSISNAYQIKSINGQYVSGPLNGWISFQSWSGFTQETRWAIDYSARQWNNRTGITTLYHSATQHNTNIRQAYDGKNLITKVSLGNSTEMMKTSIELAVSNGKYYIAEADIEINSDVPWYNNGSANGYDIQNCMTHELGHMLGLLDEYNGTYSESTMYYDTDYGETKKRTLEQDDLNGFNVIFR